jgi:electron transfer flavoprotein alpha subunit
MMPRIFAYLRHRGGFIDETASELADVAKKIDPSSALTAVVLGAGAGLDQACEGLRSLYQEVWKVVHPQLDHVDSQLAGQVLSRILPKEAVVLLAHDHFGIDVGPGLSIKLNSVYVADVIAIEYLGRTTLRVICQEFGGQFNTHVSCDIASGAVITVRPGVFRPSLSAPLNGVIVDRVLPPTALQTGRRYLETIQASTGDVDISRCEVLVSVGRGIQKQENMRLVQELATALGGVVSCSRPVADAKWLDKSRQVGTSGKTVKPKVYLACGISGQFQHMAGLKGSPFIIAINKNPKAPIFQAAHIGVVADLLEFLPELTNKVHEERAAGARR